MRLQCPRRLGGKGFTGAQRLRTGTAPTTPSPSAAAVKSAVQWGRGRARQSRAEGTASRRHPPRGGGGGSAPKHGNKAQGGRAARRWGVGEEHHPCNRTLMPPPLPHPHPQPRGAIPLRRRHSALTRPSDRERWLWPPPSAGTPGGRGADCRSRGGGIPRLRCGAVKEGVPDLVDGVAEQRELVRLQRKGQAHGPEVLQQRARGPPVRHAVGGRRRGRVLRGRCLPRGRAPLITRQCIAHGSHLRHDAAGGTGDGQGPAAVAPLPTQRPCGQSPALPPPQPRVGLCRVRIIAPKVSFSGCQGAFRRTTPNSRPLTPSPTASPQTPPPKSTRGGVHPRKRNAYGHPEVPTRQIAQPGRTGGGRGKEEGPCGGVPVRSPHI